MPVDHDSEKPKVLAAFAGARLVEDGMIVGLGSGSTATIMIRHLAELMNQEGLRITGVPSSRATAELADSLGIPLRDLDEVADLDINLDGADEIDPAFRMIKGRGGALLREKIVASSSLKRVTLITQDKRVEQLGLACPLPVEVSLFGLKHTERSLQNAGASTSIRMQPDGSPFLTDNQNAIIDCRFDAIIDPVSLDAQLQFLPGVLETGLFIELCDTLIIGSDNGVEVIQTNSPPSTLNPIGPSIGSSPHPDARPFHVEPLIRRSGP